MSIWHILAIGFGGLVLLNALGVALMARRFRIVDRRHKPSEPEVIKRAGGLSLVQNPPKERRNA